MAFNEVTTTLSTMKERYPESVSTTKASWGEGDDEAMSIISFEVESVSSSSSTNQQLAGVFSKTSIVLKRMEDFWFYDNIILKNNRRLKTFYSAPVIPSRRNIFGSKNSSDTESPSSKSSDSEDSFTAKEESPKRSPSLESQNSICTESHDSVTTKEDSVKIINDEEERIKKEISMANKVKENQIKARFHHRSLSDVPRSSNHRRLVSFDDNKSINLSKISESNAPRSRNKARQYPQNSRAPRLRSIPSGKELNDTEIVTKLLEPRSKSMNYRQTRRHGKSMTDLEFDELKGFIDLGFEFKKEDLSPDVKEIIPGLKRLENDNYQSSSSSSSSQQLENRPNNKPYLAEAWFAPARETRIVPWTVPTVPVLPDPAMKQHLKHWAKAVAFTVHQES